jgi:hypothetical protein
MELFSEPDELTMKTLPGNTIKNVFSPDCFRVIQHDDHMPVIFIVAHRYDTMVTANRLLKIHQLPVIQGLVDMDGDIGYTCTHNTPPIMAKLPLSIVHIRSGTSSKPVAQLAAEIQAQERDKRGNQRDEQCNSKRNPVHDASIT